MYEQMGKIRIYYRVLALILTSLPLYFCMNTLEFFVIHWIFGVGDPIMIVSSIVAWHSAKYFLLGLFLGTIAIPIMRYFIAPVLALEIILEAKILHVSRLVILKTRRSFFKPAIFKYAYILFGPVMLIVRIFTIVSSGDPLRFYLVAYEFIRQYAPLLVIILVLPYWLIEYSNLRELRAQNTMYFPSKLLWCFYMIIVGIGSLTALVPIYVEAVIIFGDLYLALWFIIIVILASYTPLLFLVIGVFSAIYHISPDILQKIVDGFELMVIKNVRVGRVEISLESLNT